MELIIYIVIFVVAFLISFLIYLSRKNKVHKKLDVINTSIAKENDQYLQLMTKIVNHSSFQILEDQAEVQIIQFDAGVFGFGNVDWKNLTTKNQKWVTSFLWFLRTENDQHALIKIKHGFLFLKTEPNEKIILEFISESKLSEHIKTIGKKLRS